jgi:phage terminase small subunit
MPALNNAKHEHFAQLVSNGESATQAYILAGYSANGAGQSSARLLKTAGVCERIAELREEKEKAHAEVTQRAIEKVGLTKEWVIEQLMENVAMAKQAVQVLDRKGEPTGEYKQELGAANKALELLGKEIGMFVERRETGGPGDFSDLTEDELTRQLAEAERAYAESQRAIDSARGKTAQAAAPTGD